MVVKGNVSISENEILLTCTHCGKQHSRLIVEVAHEKRAYCPHCGTVFDAKV